MEAQQFFPGFCLKSSLPSIPIGKQQLLSFKFAPNQPQNLKVYSGTFHAISIVHKVCYSSRNRIYCSRSCVEEPNVEVRGQVSVRRKKLAIFVSGGGSNFRSIHEASLKGSLHGDILVLVTNKSGCGGAEYARNNGIPVILFPKTKDESDGLSSSDLLNTVRRFEIDFILLAGYLKLVPVELIRAYERSILNIHPSLLPAFGGKGTMA